MSSPAASPEGHFQYRPAAQELGGRIEFTREGERSLRRNADSAIAKLEELNEAMFRNRRSAAKRPLLSLHGSEFHQNVANAGLDNFLKKAEESLESFEREGNNYHERLLARIDLLTGLLRSQEDLLRQRGPEISEAIENRLAVLDAPIRVREMRGMGDGVAMLEFTDISGNRVAGINSESLREDFQNYFPEPPCSSSLQRYIANRFVREGGQESIKFENWWPNNVERV